MFSGKTTAMLSKLERGFIAKKRILLIRPFIDNREFLCHSGKNYSFLEGNEIIKKELFNFNVDNYDIIGIDEGQFFNAYDNDLRNFCLNASHNKKKVYIAALHASSECNMFDSIIKLIPHCDYIEKFNAICTNCGSEIGNYTKYLGKQKDSEVLVGGKNEYTALCRECYHKI